MKYSALSTALALVLGTISLTAAAQDSRDQEIALLKEQLNALQAQIQALEERDDAQSDVNIDTAQQLDKLTTGAPKLETKGGIKVTSADGNFEAQIGGRIHFDAYAFDRDDADVTGTTEFRRARLTLQGKAFGWGYKMEQDFSDGTTTGGFRDVYINRKALGGTFTIGQFKPYRSLEELTSSNEITMMERPFSSATGLYSGRQFQQGIGYLKSDEASYTLGVTAFNLRSASGVRNEGVGAAARFTYAPINSETSTLHFGVSGSHENLNKSENASGATAPPNFSAVAVYAGRRGPSQTIASTTGASGDTITAVGLEAAGAFGPLFFQSEYARATYDQVLTPDQEVETFYVMGSWLLTGEHRQYKAATGVFGAPKLGEKGAWELTARYDTIENKDIADREASATTLGLNYYLNTNVRLMFNYTRGDNEVNGDETGQYALRTQFSF